MVTAVALPILAWLVVGCVFLYLDVAAECRFQTEAAEHEELLDQLWEDGDPRRNAEAAQTTRGTEASLRG